MSGLVIFSLILFLMLIVSATKYDFKISESMPELVSKAGVFTFLMALPIYSYPYLDLYLHEKFGRAIFWKGLVSPYSQYGMVHIPTLLLLIFLLLAWAMTPAVTGLVFEKMGGGIRWYLEKIMITEYEEIEN